MSEDANKAVLEGWQRLYVEQWDRANDAEALAEGRRLGVLKISDERDAARKERDEALQKIKGLEGDVAVMVAETRRLNEKLAEAFGLDVSPSAADTRYRLSAAAWLDAASSLGRLTYSDLHEIRQRAKENIGDALTGRPHRWTRRR